MEEALDLSSDRILNNNNNNEISEDEKDGACGMYWEEKSSVFLWRNMKERDCIDGGIIITDIHVRMGGHCRDESGSD